MNVETRKVQQVGHSTLMVSLPREWVNEVGLSQGDTVSLRREDDGSLHVLPIGVREGRESVKCIVDADKCVKEGLLTRVITGTYIIGHETLEIVSRRELRPEHIEEVRRAVQRLTGISIVEQTSNHITIKNFVDPTRFPAGGLLRRLHIITSWMQEASIRALKERDKELASEVIHMENEVDRIYWLIVRQMLLAVRDKTVGKKIGVESPLNVVGDRTIAKVLEKIGDYSESMAREVIGIIDRGEVPDKHTLKEVDEFFEMVRSIYDKSMKAFFIVDMTLANDALEDVEVANIRERELVDKILLQLRGSSIRSGRSKTTTQGKVNLYVALKAVVWNLGLIARYCSTIAEITINRNLERSSEICRFEKSIS